MVAFLALLRAKLKTSNQGCVRLARSDELSRMLHPTGS